ncbi:MAG: hypothetical protein CVT92_08835 [Bacteroidetes bacterium HGW-Bacteroidetes-1]|jgi:GNAT superfamily N-acetyltransferase|nr:MAG: hypothetical protein CVT92_08835 [Bacteroidetes bacterium HGW-Bacteroidetes-1]
MDLRIQQVRSKADLKKFIYLPEKIHANHHNWVHPLYFDDKVFFDKKKNKSFGFSDTIMCLAWNEKKLVGRIMGIINQRYNETHDEKHARFCFLECYQDIEIAKALIDEVEEWAREKGMTTLIGPLGFSDKDPQGVLIEGFTEKVVIATNYNFEWMPQFLENLGFKKKVDLVSYLVKVPEVFPEFLQKVYQRAIKNKGIFMHEFTTKKELKPWIVPIFRLMNESYKHIYGFIRLEEKEMYAYARRYLPVLDPRFVKIITDEKQQVIAFLISMPELSEGIRKAKGRILPLGWYKILMANKKTLLLTMLLGAIDETHRGIGLDAILAIKILESAQKHGMKYLDSHLILEHNQPMRAEYERFGGVLHKKYRIFSRSID